MGNKLRKKICESVKSAQVFSILADETKDFAKEEQMCFVVRFVDMSKGEIHEHFLTYVQAKHLDAQSLSSYIRNLLLQFDLDCSKVVSQGYDGASVMSGRCSGVQARVREFAPFAIYIHCYAHILNLVLVDSCKSIPAAADFFLLIEALYVFMSASKPHVVFAEKQKLLHPDKQPLALQKLSDMRWACRYSAINAVSRTFVSLLLSLEEISETRSFNQSAIEAKGLLLQIRSFSFIICLVSFDRILSSTKQLSDLLQSSTMDLFRASEIVSATKAMLSEFRSDDYWDSVYKYSTDVAQLHSISTESESNTRKRKRPVHFEEGVITCPIGFRETQQTKSDFKQQFFFPVLDKFLFEMNERFSDSNSVVLKGLAACNPASSVFLSFQQLKPFAQMYAIDITMLETEVRLISHSHAQSTIDAHTINEFGVYLHSCQPAYRNLYQIVQIGLTIAVTSAECERSFSALRRIKTRLRTTMSENRLSDLAILSIERECASECLDCEQIITEFASVDKNRRITLS